MPRDPIRPGATVVMPFLEVKMCGDLIFFGHSTPELEASKRILAWCPDCDRETAHRRLSATCRECTVCGELSADIVSVSVPVGLPA